MGFNKFVPPKCSICGKSIGWIDFMLDRVHMDYTPDSDRSEESIEHSHKRCIK